MNAAQHAKVWRGVEEDMSESAEMVKTYRITYERFKTLQVLAAAVAKNYEIVAENEKENP